MRNYGILKYGIYGVLIFMFMSLAALWGSYKTVENLRLYVDESPIENVDHREKLLQDFIASAQWVQAISAIAATVFAFSIYYQISLAKDELEFQRQIKMADEYKNISGKQYRYVRGIMRRQGVKEYFKYIDEVCQGYDGYFSLSGEMMSGVIFDVKNKIFDYVDLSGIPKVDVTGMNYIEELINEYNQFGRYFVLRVFDSKYLPVGAIKNAYTFHVAVYPYIRLRRLAEDQKEYAKDFSDWMEIERKKNNNNIPNNM